MTDIKKLAEECASEILVDADEASLATIQTYLETAIDESGLKEERGEYESGMALMDDAVGWEIEATRLRITVERLVGLLRKFTATNEIDALQQLREEAARVVAKHDNPSPPAAMTPVAPVTPGGRAVGGEEPCPTCDGNMCAYPNTEQPCPDCAGAKP